MHGIWGPSQSSSTFSISLPGTLNSTDSTFSITAQAAHKHLHLCMGFSDQDALPPTAWQSPVFFFFFSVSRITVNNECKFDKLKETVKAQETWCAVVHGMAESDMTQWLNNNVTFYFEIFPSAPLLPMF